MSASENSSTGSVRRGVRENNDEVFEDHQSTDAVPNQEKKIFRSTYRIDRQFLPKRGESEQEVRGHSTNGVICHLTCGLIIQTILIHRKGLSVES